MKSIKLDSVLLLALIIPLVMTYRISPGNTPYWLFGLVFLGLIFNIILDLLHINEKKYLKYKSILLWLLILLTLGAAGISSIIVRNKVAPVYMVHDIILQLEAAIRFFLDGINPYATTYFGTFLEQWNYSATEINPALYHFVMQPFYLLFSLPFYYISVHTVGFFDGRIPLFFLFLVLLVMAFMVVNDPERKRLFVMLLAFNPAMLAYTLEGRSDVFMYAFFFAGLYLLHKGKDILAGLPFGLAFAVKQSAWPFLPFYFAYLLFKTGKISLTIKQLSLFVMIVAIITMPFLLWNPKAFMDSTVLYLSGSTSHSYPISGYGLGMVLHELGWIKDLKIYYPFMLWQVIICMPLLFFLLKYLKKNMSLQKLILVYGIFLFVYWYLSRYFNNSHLGYLSMVFITAYFWPEKEMPNEETKTS